MKLARVWVRLSVSAFLLSLSGFAFGQYTGTPGTPGYVAPAGGYKASTGVIIGAVAAAGGVVAYLLLRRGDSLVGCIASHDGQPTLTTHDHKVYVLTGDRSDLQPGERMKLSGKKVTPQDGPPAFDIRKPASDLGSCS